LFVTAETVEVAPAALAEEARRRYDMGFHAYVLAQGVESKDGLAVMHLIRRPTDGAEVWLLAKLDPQEPRAASLISVYEGADWFERETAEMFGIVFDGHPDLRHLLLPADWSGFPLRKSYPIDAACPPYRPVKEAKPNTPGDNT
jgi:NADH-quinone oxidoreductase subunit C